MTQDHRSKVLFGGAPEGFDAYLLARELSQSARPILYIARDDKALEAMRFALLVIAPDVVVLDFPAWDCLPYDRISPNSEIIARRMATLWAISCGIRTPFILLTTLNAATQLVPAQKNLSSAVFCAALGDRIDEEALKLFLVHMGFSLVSTVVEPGDYAIRGGIIDIFPPGQEHPVRLDFFGDTLDGIRRFDSETQKTLDRLEKIEIFPASEVFLTPSAITRFRQNYRVEFGASGTGNSDPLYTSISAGQKHQGMEHWLGFFHDQLESIFDYLPDSTLIFGNQFEAARIQRWESVSDAYNARCDALNQSSKTRMDTLYKPAPPLSLYLDDEAWKKQTLKRKTIQLSPNPQSPGPNVLDAGGRFSKNFSVERNSENTNLFDELAKYVNAQKLHNHVVIACWSEGSRERLLGLLNDHGCSGGKSISDFRQISEDKGQVFLVVWPLDAGFQVKQFYKSLGLVVLSEQDILGERLLGRPRKKRKAENFLRDVDALSAGDLIVHAEHGVGRFLGLETISALGAPHDCVALEYAEATKLYLPVENIELLSRYGHEVGLLDRLGSGAWQEKKARLKKRIKEVAEKLMRIAAERTLRCAPVFEPPAQMWDDFCARFPYQETDDQLAAIDDVVSDLEKGTPMDRLVVGDVGFGKTEVAMRAAFLAVSSGMQVALICPTTLLARQHYRSFVERFRGFPIKIRQLSRFVSDKEAKATRQGLSDGHVDIVIGTHALLAKGVQFKNLGLMVVDEEQHFGVSHKERLKEMRSEIHVLTLTATPIPRTLQLSLTGVRDLSIIATPPVDRLAIRSYVSEFDTVTIREALLRERYRGGQAFWVVPRISDIKEIEDFLQTHVPEVSYTVANGQMAAGELDERMNHFYDGKYDVLLATSIVESGLDIPTANTMIIHRADMFGLGQLYQIRGRVGRAKTRAYCYLTTKPRAPLTPQAQKRLKLMVSLDSLGAGFNLASHDLDLRGAGNLLGEEQSGHIKEVGYELYQNMLEETISKLKSGEFGDVDALESQWSPQLNLGLPVMIPEGYIPDIDIRLGLYRRLSGLNKKMEIESFAAELVDRFGSLPKEVNALMVVVRIKAVAKQAGIARIDAGPKGATIQFHNDKFSNPAGLVEFITAHGANAKVQGNKIVIAAKWLSDSERVKGVFAIARDLAEKAREPTKQLG